MKLLVVKTVLTTEPEEAAEFIKSGCIVAFPTETVYGLGADIFDETAVAKVFEAKRRPADNPLIAHISTLEQLNELTRGVTENAQKLIEAFFPGPLTLVFEKTARVPQIATAGLNTIGIRMPSLDLAQRFLVASKTPVVAPSANLSGRPSPTTWQAVLEDLDGRIDCILQGGDTEIGLESTVVDCTGDASLVLRVGAVSLEKVQAVVPGTQLYSSTSIEAPRSPGLRHKHYSPRASVKIIEAQFEISNLRSGFIGINRPKKRKPEIEHICGSVEEYAHSLFEFFRECDRRGIATIYCESVPEVGMGTALMDRIRRAAI